MGCFSNSHSDADRDSEIEERICFPGRLGDGEGDDWNDVNKQTVF